MHLIDRFLNTVTMYRLTLGGLQFLAALAIVFAAVGILPYDAISMLLSLLILTTVSYGTNALFVKLLNAAPGKESSSITAFILFFLFMPPLHARDGVLLAGSACAAIASKYIFAIRGRHIFNPAAFGAFFASIFLGVGATWWVATPSLLPFVAVLGFLMAHKIRRLPLYFVGIASAVVILFLRGLLQETLNFSLLALGDFLALTFISWPILFFAGVMLTEPATTPPTLKKQLGYGTIAGILFSLPIHAGMIFMTPELALLFANIFSYIVGAKDRLRLTLVGQKTIAKDIFHFSFSSPRPLLFAAGQYLEWTLPHKKSDNRGNRRYFTIASSPTEKYLGLGVKITEKSSSFKKALKNLQPGDYISVSQCAGDFLLPRDHQEKLVFIAGGIGITPFRSMISWMCDQKMQRDCILLYAATTPEDFAYTDVFARAEKDIGLKTLFIAKDAPASWNGLTGILTKEILSREIPDYRVRHFYLSGPGAMVDAYKSLILSLGVSRKNITTDYFPGL